MSSPPTIESKHALLRDEVLNTFAERCKDSGARSVSMVSLVAQIGISTKTLYRLFSSKNDILNALMQRWADTRTLHQQQGLAEGLHPKARITNAALAWLDTHNRFGEAFWNELPQYFPSAQEIYEHEYQAFLQRSRNNLMDSIRPDINADLALSSLMALIAHASDPTRCRKLKMRQADAVIQTIELWSKGALRSAEDKAE
jgi:AcrR family transcriptional regulator